jgi:two-component system, cell cycle response regulator DivK
MRVLIAEDNAENLDMLRRRLERRGYTVFAAQDGQMAVEQTLALRPDIVLMDVSMPVLSGLEATRAIRQIPDVAHTPIVALTAHAMDGDRARCLEAGCDAYATKPVDLPNLVATMERLAPAPSPVA